jgi:rubrerythrin
MDEHLVGTLQEIIAQESQAVMRCLVAAELAVEDGRFNIAKVMRAAAHTARVRAMQLQRLLTTQVSPTLAVQAEQARRHVQQATCDTALRLAHHGEDATCVRRLQQVLAASAPLDDILARAVASLRSHRDVMESDVAQSVWGCHDCGYLVETEAPDTCPYCGALGAEFEWFGPFYSATQERLGRRRAEEIVAMIRRSPAELATVFAGVDEEALGRRPSPSEWCMKETAGHMLDVTELFVQRVQTLLGSDTPRSVDTPVPPWKLLEGKGYPNMDGAVIVDRFRRATDEALALIHTLSDAEWTRQGWNRGRPCNILDLGTWLANHSLAHRKQLEALRAQFTP